MFNADSLRYALTSFYHDAVASDAHKYDQEQVDALLEEIDFEALAQALRNRMKTVYAYITQGRKPKSFNYRGSELFGQRAALIYEDFDRGSEESVTAARVYELWLLEDTSIVAVSSVSVGFDIGAYVTVYREAIGDPWFCPADIDLTEITGSFLELCDCVYGGETPVYEL